MSTDNVVGSCKFVYESDDSCVQFPDGLELGEAVGIAARWLSDNPLEPGGTQEAVLEDPFDYVQEDRLLNWWRSATADPPDLNYPVEPGYGAYYSGPGTSRRRSDTRI